MTNILITVALILGSTLYLWVLYLAAMSLIPRKDSLPLFTRMVGYPLVAFGFLLDVVYNVTVGSLLFLELPELRHLTLTARVSKWNDDPDWRGAVARWICANLLDPFQAGGHCR